VWPIRAIKGVGIKAARAIAETCSEKRPKSMEEFYIRIPKRSANKRVIHKLIAAGAFRGFGTQLEVAVEYFERLRKEILPEEFDIHISNEDAWQDLRDDTLGYMERSYKDRFSDWFGKKVSTVSAMIAAGENDFLLMGGKVTMIYEHKGWSGKMLFLTITDLDGSFPVFMSPDFLKRLDKRPEVGNIVEVFGRKGYTKRNEDELLMNSKDCELEIYSE